MDKIPHPTFVILYKKFTFPLMKFLVKRMGGDQDATEEVFSQTIIAAWQGFHTFQHKSKFFTWLCRIALNKMADYYRQQVHERSVLVAPTLETLANLRDRDLLPDEKLVLVELRASVRECLELLPAEKRQLLYLRFWKDLSIKKIAELTGSSERAIEGKIYRAKLALKNILSARHPETIPVRTPFR